MLIIPFICTIHYSAYLRCANDKCSGRAKIVLRKQTDEVVNVTLSGKKICIENDSFRHHSAPETRKAMEEEILNVGATEAFENVQEIHADPNFTKQAARTHVARFRHRQLVPPTWPRDLMLCLVLLRETQKEEISPDKKPVSGYIQVRNREIIIQLHPSLEGL